MSDSKEVHNVDSAVEGQLKVFSDESSLSASILLFVATFLAIVAANSQFFSDFYMHLWEIDFGLVVAGIPLSMTLHHWINDGLMAIFFLMVGLEIKRELLIGELSDPKKAMGPLVAAIGGMVVPAFIYITINPDLIRGFGIPMATDIAFALGVIMMLGSRVNPSLKLFLVTLAVIDDLGAILVVAIVYTEQLHLDYIIYSVLVYIVLIGLRRTPLKNKLIPYLLLGIFLWYFIHHAGIHATIAGVLLAFTIPISPMINERVFSANIKKSLEHFNQTKDATPLLTKEQRNALNNMTYNVHKVRNPLVYFEHKLHTLVSYFIMPLFAFANAGFLINAQNVNTHIFPVLGVFLGLLLGKPIGIMLFTWSAHKLNIIQKPTGVGWMDILGVSFLAGIGFTMSIFINNLAFSDGGLIDAIKIAIFSASIIACFSGIMIIKFSSRKQGMSFLD